MKYFTAIIVVLCCPLFSFCQDITGLWKGTVFNDDTQQSYRYEILISKDNGKLSGFSHTWFQLDGKEYYGIKKINVRVAKDGKIVMQDATMVENNYPETAPKNVFQLNVLDLSNINDEVTLNGPFVTNRSKQYDALSGRVNVKKVSLASQSYLLQYLHKNSIDNTLTVLK